MYASAKNENATAVYAIVNENATTALYGNAVKNPNAYAAYLVGGKGTYVGADLEVSNGCTGANPTPCSNFTDGTSCGDAKCNWNGTLCEDPSDRTCAWFTTQSKCTTYNCQWLEGQIKSHGKVIVDSAGNLSLSSIDPDSFDTGSSGFMVLGANPTFTCTTVCNNHGLTCSAAYTLDGIDVACSSSTNIRYCWCQ